MPNRVFRDEPAYVGIIIPRLHVVQIIPLGHDAPLPGVLERLRDGFGLPNYSAIRIIGIGVDGLPAGVGDGHRVAGAVEVVAVELAAGGIH